MRLSLSIISQYYVLSGYYSTAVAEVAFCIVYYGKLSRGYSLNTVLRFDYIFPVVQPCQCAGLELGSVTVLERYRCLVALFAPRITRDEVHFVEMQGVAILLLGVVAVAYIDYIVMNVLLDNIPWAAAKSESFALAYCVKPESVVFAYFSSGFKFDDCPLLYSEVAFYKIVVVYLAEETYSPLSLRNAFGIRAAMAVSATAALGMLPNGNIR